MSSVFAASVGNLISLRISTVYDPCIAGPFTVNVFSLELWMAKEGRPLSVIV